MAHYFIFGYGSLIYKDSRDKSGESGDSIPVKVNGIRRGWNIAISQARAVALGATQETTARCNGVIFSVAGSEIAKFDEREIKHGYNRIILGRDTVARIDGKPIPDGEIFAYASAKAIHDVPRDIPLIQSYIDVTMTGCLLLGGEAFAREFVHTADGWNRAWENDRAFPRYPRPLKEVLFAETIDRILAEEIPRFFSRRAEVTG